jgi:hypothetical protein
MEAPLAPRGGAEIDTYRELLRLGYKLSPTTRTEVHEHKVGVQTITYAHRLLVSGGPGPLKGELREAVRTHQPLLLAAACVVHPPMRWMLVLVDNYLTGELVAEGFKIRGHKDAYRVVLAAVAANVAAFIGQHPLTDGPRLEAIIEEALT